jgi:hypothetical protein
MVNKEHPSRLTTADEVVTQLEAYLASLGLTDFESELCRYLCDPRAHRDSCRKWLLDSYLRVGRRVVEKGDRERALEIFRTVLNLTGVSSRKDVVMEEALVTKRVWRRKTSWKRYVIWGVLLLVALGIFGWFYAQKGFTPEAW